MSRLICFIVVLGTAWGSAGGAEPEHPLGLERGDRIVFVGNTFAERMQLFGHFEALLTARFADLDLHFRNMGWSADTLWLRPRPLNFGDMHTHLHEQGADVIFACFGMNESFAGEAGLERFEAELDEYLMMHAGMVYNGEGPPRVVLVSPIAHERVGGLPVDVAARNEDLGAYVGVMEEAAGEHGVTFLDLFTPTRERMSEETATNLTINGIHVNERGDWVVSRMMMEGLGFDEGMRAAPGTGAAALEALREAINEKNRQWFYRWRPVNGEYVYGRRKEPFGVVNFPPEMEELERMIAEREERIWELAEEAAEHRYE